MEQINSQLSSIITMMIGLVILAACANLVVDMLTKPSKSKKRKKATKSSGAGILVALALLALALYILLGGKSYPAGQTLLGFAGFCLFLAIVCALLLKPASPVALGQAGEHNVSKELKLLKLFGRDGTILRNVYVPTSAGETSEIDVIYVTRKGVFVVESKAYSGWIFGSATDRNWTVCYKDGHKELFYNPVMQNATHCQRLGEYLGNFLLGVRVPLFSIVAFSDRCELKKVDGGTTPVVKRSQLFATIRRIWDVNPDALRKAQVAQVASALEPLTHANETIKTAHIDSIRKRFGER